MVAKPRRWVASLLPALLMAGIVAAMVAYLGWSRILAALYSVRLEYVAAAAALYVVLWLAKAEKWRRLMALDGKLALKILEAIGDNNAKRDPKQPNKVYAVSTTVQREDALIGKGDEKPPLVPVRTRIESQSTASTAPRGARRRIIARVHARVSSGGLFTNHSIRSSLTTFSRNPFW